MTHTEHTQKHAFGTEVSLSVWDKLSKIDFAKCGIFCLQDLQGVRSCIGIQCTYQIGEKIYHPMLLRTGLFPLLSVSFLVCMVSGQIPPCPVHQPPKQPTVVPNIQKKVMCKSFCFIVTCFLSQNFGLQSQRMHTEFWRRRQDNIKVELRKICCESWSTWK